MYDENKEICKAQLDYVNIYRCGVLLRTGVPLSFRTVRVCQCHLAAVLLTAGCGGGAEGE